MASKKIPGWLLGCGIGCGVVLFLVLVVLGIGAVSMRRMMGDVDRAIAIRAEVEERFDTPDSFTPAPDGAVPADRLARFLQVREALEPQCARFDAVTGRMEEMERRDEPPELSEIFGFLGGALGLPRLLADYVGVRNQALLDAEMGWGEYTYIYVVAYASGPAADEEDARRRRKALSKRVRGAVIGMLERQRDLLAGEKPGSGLLPLLDAEIEALERDADRRPWEDGLPESMALSLGPAREELDRLACPLAAEFALGRTERRGLTIHGN